MMTTVSVDNVNPVYEKPYSSQKATEFISTILKNIHTESLDCAPTNPLDIHSELNRQQRLAEVLTTFKIIGNERAIVSYLNQYSSVFELFLKIGRISDSSFKNKTDKSIELIYDRELKQNVLCARIRTGITDEEVFWKGEDALFDTIKKLELESALDHMILSLY